MAALDKKLRGDTQFELMALQRTLNLTFIIVTHDPHAAHFASTIRYIDKGELLPPGQKPQDWN